MTFLRLYGWYLGTSDAHGTSPLSAGLAGGPTSGPSLRTRHLCYDLEFHISCKAKYGYLLSSLFHWILHAQTETATLALCVAWIALGTPWTPWTAEWSGRALHGSASERTSADVHLARMSASTCLAEEEEGRVRRRAMSLLLILLLSLITSDSIHPSLLLFLLFSLTSPSSHSGLFTPPASPRKLLDPNESSSAIKSDLVSRRRSLQTQPTSLSDEDTRNQIVFTPKQLPIMPQKKIRCTFKECKDAAQRIVGDCGFCNGHFCGKHRLLEDHKCDGLEDCKKQSHERNAAQLESERTQVIRGV
ncbi:AN1-type zinc finger protein [Colletotrichum cuscutae]|uniref:AN1-type zinc finger protein n=1 Tax=Colletotrichum cuscutae TaxID=1209917 RepID=A0AAI9VCD5_9PEZI|nr:AN1-type zinc finger protein [Colletotrichum cuscutae]